MQNQGKKSTDQSYETTKEQNTGHLTQQLKCSSHSCLQRFVETIRHLTDNCYGQQCCRKLSRPSIHLNHINRRLPLLIQKASTF